MALRTALWRGVLVSADMIEPLNELDRLNRLRGCPSLKPIPGYGSYRNNSASGGTDNGSGHLDCYGGDGWTTTTRNICVSNARRVGFMQFYRPKTWWSPIRKRWMSATWGRHFHFILKDSADLSAGAEAQLIQWYRGSNGLAGFWAYGEFLYDPDPYNRTYLYQTWNEYLSKGGTQLTNTTTTTTTSTATEEEEPMNQAQYDVMLAKFNQLLSKVDSLPAKVWDEEAPGNPATLDQHALNANIKAGAALGVVREVKALAEVINQRVAEVQGEVDAIKAKLGMGA